MNQDFGQLQQNDFGEWFYPQINGHSFIKNSAESLFSHFFSDFRSLDEQLFIIIGSDSGLIYQYLKKQEDLPEHNRYLIIDFAGAYQHINPQEPNFEDQVVLVDDRFEISQVSNYYLSYVVRQKLKLVRSFAVQDGKRDGLYAALWQRYQDTYSGFIRQELVSLNSKPFIDAQLQNLGDNLVPFAKVKNKMEGAVALILGGGPTLDDSIEWIRENQQRVIVFSAARIARRLIKEGIVPDVFVSVDPHDISFDNSKGIFNFSESSLLVHSHHINPKILGQWSGVSTYLGSQAPWVQKDEFNTPSQGPNVINTALLVAFELGCSTFIFSGVDLCFVGKEAFESGSDEAKVGGKFVFHDVQMVENNAGGMSQTQPMYALGRDTLERQVKIYSEHRPGLNFITFGLQSAKIEGVQYMPTSELALQGNDINFEIESLMYDLRLDLKERIKHTKSVAQLISKQKKRFHEIMTQADKGLGLIQNIYNDQGEENTNVVKQFLKVKKKVNQLVGEDGDMLFHYEYSGFQTSFKPIKDEQNMAQEEVSEQLSGFYEGVKSASEKFLKALNRASDRVKLRMNELLGIKLDDCVEEWQKIEEPGRALLWQKWHSEANESSKALISQQIDAFEELVSRSDTKQVQELSQKSKNLPHLFSRALKAFDDEDLNELSDIETHIDNLELQSGLDGLKQFVQAMQLELKGSMQDALQIYQGIDFPSLRHQALKRALHLSTELRNNELSLQFLEQLCQYSLDYMLPYSTLLEMIGHPDVSIEVLKLYVTNHPKNEMAQLQLSQKLIRYGRGAEAEPIINAVLAYNPNNQTAQQLKAAMQ